MFFPTDIKMNNSFSILGHDLADRGYYINLSESVERKDYIEKQIIKFNIKNLYRFEALKDEIRQYSCTKSHRAIYEEAIAQSLDYIFVAEDDFTIHDLFKIKINLDNYLNNIKTLIKNYDIIMFGCNPKKQLIPDNRYFAFNTASSGAWAYIINRRAMEYILKNYEYYKDYQAVDDILPFLNNKGFKTVVSVPQICGHRDGVESTLQPHVGLTYYSGWIDGSWDKTIYNLIPNEIKQNLDLFQQYLLDHFILEKNLTILITGHRVDNWLFYLRYLLKSLPKQLYTCRFIICYDSLDNTDKFEINRYFRDIRSDIYPSIEYVDGGLISSLKRGLQNIQTPYFLWLEHDWVFLDNYTINWIKLINSFNKYSFINAVWFNKDDNRPRGYETHNYNNTTTPFEREDRVSEIDLITSCRWSNNPALFRTQKTKEWFDQYINNEYVDKINQGSYNIEEGLINIYRNQIDLYGWEKIKDEWGTFLYGKIGEGPFVGHTDASKRYTGESQSDPEINGINYMNSHLLNEDE
jgi:GR25 family glycosyltransferase involved in LPS biosynthesis